MQDKSRKEARKKNHENTETVVHFTMHSDKLKKKYLIT